MAENNIQMLDYNNSPFDSLEQIYRYGDEAIKGVSRFADDMLKQLRIPAAEESSKLITELNRLIKSINKNNFYGKYKALGRDFEKIFARIKQYELELKDSNDILRGLYEKNIHFYRELEQYIQLADKYIKINLSPVIEALDGKGEDPAGGLSQIKRDRFLRIKETLEQRMIELRTSKTLSLQTKLQLDLILKCNLNIEEKINSAFVITLPQLNQGILQAVKLKRQRIFTESMEALKASARKLIRKNIKNNSSRQTLMESIEESYKTIINGIDEIELLEDENKRQRRELIKKLEEYKIANADRKN